jgi:phospholipid transport system substrate-binding protein
LIGVRDIIFPLAYFMIRKVTMKKFIFIFLSIISISLAQAEPNNQAPDQFVDTMITDVITTLKNNNELIRNHEKMSAFVDSQIIPHFDVALMARKIVGEQAWDKASSDEKSNLSLELKLFYEHLFAKTLAEYTDQTVKISSFIFNANKDEAIVKGELIEKAEENSSLSFRLKANAAEWKIANITVGGVDLISTYQSNFKSIVNEGGVAKLVDELHKKNQALLLLKKS